MTAPATAPAQALADLLAAAEAALAQGDAEGAARAVQDAAHQCQQLAATRVTLDRADLDRLAGQHARIAARAGEVRELLAAQLDALGRSRRAAAAYRGR